MAPIAMRVSFVPFALELSEFARIPKARTDCVATVCVNSLRPEMGPVFETL
jgi:hypothetical protein